VVPISSHGWERGGPFWLRCAVWTLGVLGSPKFRPLFALARKGKDKVPKDMKNAEFKKPDMQEIASILATERKPTKTEFAS